MSNEIYSSVNHYEYPSLDVSCTCALCGDWRDKRSKFERMKVLTSRHPRDCFCWKCYTRRDLQVAYLASLNKRDLYCEMSWHAAHHPNYGSKLMTWVVGEIHRDDRGENWWSIRALDYPLSFWLLRFQRSMTAAVSAVSGMVA